MWLMTMACGSLPVCDCPADTPGHAVELDGQCSCLPHLPATPLPEDATVMQVGDGASLDWDAIDAALEDGDVIVVFEPGDRWPRLEVLRRNEGPHRLVLDGGGASGRAIVEGVLTPFDEGPRHRVTVRGFEITGSRDKGIFWEAGGRRTDRGCGHPRQSRDPSLEPGVQHAQWLSVSWVHRS